MAILPGLESLSTLMRIDGKNMGWRNASSIFLMITNIVNYEKMKKVIFKTRGFGLCLGKQLVNISCGRKIIHVALSGGSTPKLLFKILASTYKMRLV